MTTRDLSRPVPGARRRRHLAWVALLLVLSLIAAACGDSDDDSSSDDAEAGATTAADADTGDTDDTSDDDAADESGDTDETQPPDTAGGVEGDAPDEASVEEIRIGVPSLQEQYVDPHFAVGGLLFPMRWAIAEPLYRQTLDLEWVPNLATGYEISEDELTWTFTLRDDVTMHDGSNFTAADVKTAIDRVLGSEDFAHLASFRSMVTGAEVIDDYTVAVTTSAPYATLLSDIEAVPPIPTDYYNEVGEEGFREAPMAAGAWMFESQALNSSITYTRFDDYFDPERLNNFERLVYEIVPDESARVAGVQTGALDMAFGLTALSAEQIEESGEARIVQSPDTGLAYIFALDLVNPENETLLFDQRVRQALLEAVDREAIAESLYRGFARVPDSPVPPTTLGYEPYEPYPYDPDNAQALLEEAGATDLSVTLNSYNSTPTVPDVVKLAETIAAYWEQIGVSVDLNVADTATILPAWRDRALDGTGLLAGPSSYYNEPTRLASSFFSTDASYSVVSNPEIDALVAEINQTVDLEAREELGRQYGQLLHDEVYGLPIVLISSLIAVGPNVAEFEPMLGTPYAGPVWSLQAN